MALLGVSIDKVRQDFCECRQIFSEHSHGYTSAGIIRVNDSIRTDVYCLLGAQMQAWASGSSLEDQQQ